MTETKGFSKQEETNHVSYPKVQTEQPVQAQKPMSIEAYTKALRAEAEVAKLRATIAKSMFEENMAMAQLNQLRAGQFNPPQAQPTKAPAETPEDSPEETTHVD